MRLLSDYLEIACGDNQSIKLKKFKDKEKNHKILENLCLGSQIKKGSIIYNA